MPKKLNAVHPGEVLREEFMLPHGLTAYALAGHLDIPRDRIEKIVREQSSVTADTALRLGKYFNTTPAFWIGLQGQFDIETAKDEISKEIEKIKPIAAVA